MKPKEYQIISRERTQGHEVTNTLHSTTSQTVHERVIKKFKEARHNEPCQYEGSYGNSKPLRVTAIAVSVKYKWLNDAQKAELSVGRVFPSAAAAAEVLGVKAQTIRAMMHAARLRDPSALRSAVSIRGVVLEQIDPDLAEG